MDVQPLRRDIVTDVAVIGAGVCGAVVAEMLTATHRVVVIDRRGPARGATMASTALVEYEVDVPLTELSRKIGREKAARAYSRSYRALNALADRTRALGIACDFVRRDNLYLAGNVLDANGIAEEAAARNAIGLETLFLSRSALRERFGIGRAAALLAYGDFTVDPRRLAIGYLNAAIANGATIHAPVTAAKVHATRSDVAVETDAGPTIRAKHAIFATGYELPDMVPAKGHRVISTYAIATRPQRRKLWPEEVLIWEASEPYLYMRTTADGRIVCGGEDEPFSDDDKRDALIGKKARTIARKIERLFPDIDATPAFAWAGAFGTTETGLPSIGRVPRHPRCWAVLGFGGNGMTYARIAADIIAADLSGRRDPDAALYSFR